MPPAASVVKGLTAPARPDAPWAAPDLRTFSEPLRADHSSEIDPQKDYELAELIDLAERENPETKVAWARAKEAAAGVGPAKSEYYPMLALKASFAWVNLPVPLPESTSQAGYLSVEAQEAHAVAILEWVLLDFGRRAQHELEDARDKAVSQVWRYYTDTKLAIRRLTFRIGASAVMTITGPAPAQRQITASNH